MGKKRKKTNPWKSVFRHQPPTRVPVLVYCQGSNCVGIASWAAGGWWIPEPQAVAGPSITYWKPRPTGPK